MRASQLDAARLDSELTAMLKEQFMRIFSLFQPVSSGLGCCHPDRVEHLCYTDVLSAAEHAVNFLCCACRD